MHRLIFQPIANTGLIVFHLGSFRREHVGCEGRLGETIRWRTAEWMAKAVCSNEDGTLVRGSWVSAPQHLGSFRNFFNGSGSSLFSVE